MANFVRDIPLSPKHPSWAALAAIEAALPKLAGKPMLIAWGERDFCFDDTFFAAWRERFPRAETPRGPAAGHYLFEAAGARLVPAVVSFLSA